MERRTQTIHHNQPWRNEEPHHHDDEDGDGDGDDADNDVEEFNNDDAWQ